MKIHSRQQTGEQEPCLKRRMEEQTAGTAGKKGRLHSEAAPERKFSIICMISSAQ